MIIRKRNIRRWDCEFLFSFDTHDKERIQSALLWADAPDSLISDVSKNVDAGDFDTGFTFSNPWLRRTVLAVGKTSSGSEFLNTTVHEIVHMAQHIAGQDGIDPLSEKFAYLCGDISALVSDIVCKMSCPHCRRE